MKKAFIALLSSLLVLSCGGPDPKPIEATYGPIGDDSSMILPPLVDTVVKPSDSFPVLDTSKAVE